jgi:hypothetical protein
MGGGLTHETQPSLKATKSSGATSFEEGGISPFSTTTSGAPSTSESYSPSESSSAFLFSQAIKDGAVEIMLDRRTTTSGALNELGH